MREQAVPEGDWGEDWFDLRKDLRPHQVTVHSEISETEILLFDARGNPLVPPKRKIGF